MTAMMPHASRLTPHGFFVTGTDTGVGKTLLACALLLGFAREGRRVVGMKPVATGARRDAGHLISDDVARLRAASNVEAPLAIVNPYCFEPPIAPHLAAARAGVDIELVPIARAYAQLTAMAEVVVVEGIGGFCVPLNRNFDTSDLAHHLELPVILVVGMRLGCLNHALLTARAIRGRGLTLAGWIANRIDLAMAEVDANIAALAERLGAPPIGAIEFALEPDAGDIAAQLKLSSLP